MLKEPRPETRAPAAQNPFRSYIANSLFRRLFSVTLPALLALIVVSATAVTGFTQLRDDTQSVRTHLAASVEASEIEMVLLGLKTNLEGQVTPGARYTPAPVKELWDTLAEESTNLRQMDAATLSPQEQAQIAQVLAGLDSLGRHLDQAQALAPATSAAPAPAGQAALQAEVGALRTQSESVADGLRHAADQQVATLDGKALTNERLILLLALISVAGSLLLATRYANSTMQPIARLKRGLAQAATGDLSASPPDRPAAQDPLLALEWDFHHTLSMLRPLIARIQADAARIDGAAGDITTTATQQVMGAAEQVQALTNVTHTVDELNGMVGQITAASSGVAVAAGQARTSATQGQEAVRKSIEGITSIRERVSEITTRNLTLAAQSRQIGEIIDLIDDIAQNTHLLALNAAIESAGAGPHGRRFAVIATEVRALAQHTVEATGQVRAFIEEIQTAAAAAMAATEAGLLETERGTQVVQETEQANQGVLTVVGHTADLAEQIRLATQAQHAASEQLAMTMREVVTIAEYATSGARNTLTAANELNTIAAGLRTAVQGFRLPAPERV